MRVIAGLARGVPLRAPPTNARPTGDKIKGAIFSMLEAEAMRRGTYALETDDRVVLAAQRRWKAWLDLYAGSGALGIEALSRGAESVDFVESNKAARETIHANLLRAKLAERARLLTRRADALFAAPERRYDVVLLDPPYQETQPAEVLERVDRARLVAPGGVVILEHARERDAPVASGALRLLRSRVHGKTAISLYENTLEA